MTTVSPMPNINSGTKYSSASNARRHTRNFTGAASTSSSGATFGSKLGDLGKAIWKPLRIAGNWAWNAVKAVAGGIWKVSGAAVKSCGKGPMQWIAGLTAAGIVGYNLIKDTPQKIRRESREELAETYTNLFESSQTTSKYSNLNSKMKGAVRDKIFDSRIYSAYVKVKNAVCTTAGELVNNAVPIILATGAMGAEKITKYMEVPKAGKPVAFGCTALLVASGIKTLFTDIFNFRQKKI